MALSFIKGGTFLTKTFVAFVLKFYQKSTIENLQNRKNQ